MIPELGTIVVHKPDETDPKGRYRVSFDMGQDAESEPEFKPLVEIRIGIDIPYDPTMSVAQIESTAWKEAHNLLARIVGGDLNLGK